jgi:hypothetical protein
MLEGKKGEEKNRHTMSTRGGMDPPPPNSGSVGRIGSAALRCRRPHADTLGFLRNALASDFCAEEADPVESAIPEQFVSRYRGGRWVTEAVSHSGG